MKFSWVPGWNVCQRRHFYSNLSVRLAAAVAGTGIMVHHEKHKEALTGSKRQLVWKYCWQSGVAEKKTSNFHCICALPSKLWVSQNIQCYGNEIRENGGKFNISFVFLHLSLLMSYMPTFGVWNVTVSLIHL